MSEDEIRITKALEDAKDTIRDLRAKLDVAIETLEEYEYHVLLCDYPWAIEPAVKALEKIR